MLKQNYFYPSSLNKINPKTVLKTGHFNKPLIKDFNKNRTYYMKEEVHDTYLHPKNYIPKLQIYQKLPEITNAIKNSMITIVRSDTGTGKTIGIPNFLSREQWLQRNIFCSVPTITATISAYEFQIEQFDNDQNYVGYACNGNTRYDYNTRIIYCTTSYLLNKMIRTVSNVLKGNYGRHDPWFCSVLILDEFHTRSKETDICLCLWIASYKAWVKNPQMPKPPKLVIMSATLNNSIIKLLPIEPSILSYTFHTYPVNIIFDNKSAVFSIDSKERYIHAANIAFSYHLRRHKGIYMILVPGKQEIDIVYTALKKLFRKESADILQLHGDLNVEDLQKIYDPVINGKRKIIIATNIAEYSITINDVSLVIDTMTQREITSSLDESLRLDLHWISKSNFKQRKGRTGRNCPGIYVALQSENMFSNLPDKVTPEIDRVSISYDILKLMRFGLDPKIILAPIIAEWQIDVYISLLNKLGFINNLGEVFTEMSDFCSEFPLSIRKSAMLYHLKNLNDNNVFLHLAVICTLSCYESGIFLWPKKKSNEEIFSYSMRCDDAIQKIEDNFGGYSDIDTFFNIWIKICSTINPFYITDLKVFCRNNNLNFRRFKEIVILLKQCIFIGNHNRIYLNAYHNVNSFVIPDTKDLGKTFYYLLTLTHQDYETIITYNLTGQLVGICAGLEHRIDNRSIHLMNLGNNKKQIYYSLIRSQKKTKKGIIRIINVLHTIPDTEQDDEKFSIFSSDSELDLDFDEQLPNNPEKQRNKSSIKRWTSYLSIIESNLLDNDMDIQQLPHYSFDQTSNLSRSI